MKTPFNRYASVLERVLRVCHALVGSLLLTLVCRAAAADAMRALIITGVDYPGHHWWETTPVLQEELAKDPRIQVDVFKDPDDLGAKKLAGYDVLILHFMNWEKPEPDARARENLRSFVDRGGGLVGIHFACGAFSNWNEYPNLLGRVWDRTNTHDPRGVFRVDLVNADHPIFCYAPRLEDCHDGMDAPTNPASDNSYPVPVPGRTRFAL